MYTSESEEKRAIMQHLRNYRKSHGLGCLQAVAKATRTSGRINDSTLRTLLFGMPASMLIDDWRKIEQALNIVEEKKNAEVLA